MLVPFLKHSYTTDSYISKAFFATVTGPEVHMLKDKPNELKELILARLDKKYLEVRKQIEEA